METNFFEFLLQL